MSKSSRNNFKSGDFFTVQARKKGYRARSAFKLLEISKQDNLFRQGMKVLDLGSFPGGWSQVASDLVGNSGLVVAIDRQKMQPIKNTHFIQMNMQDLDLNKGSQSLGNNSFDLVLSDLAPNISGIQEKDDAEMIALIKKVFKISENYLKQKGHLLIKVFQGQSFKFTKNYMDSNFQRVKIRKPDSSRSVSSETYLLACEKNDYRL